MKLNGMLGICFTLELFCAQLCSAQLSLEEIENLEPAFDDVNLAGMKEEDRRYWKHEAFMSGLEDLKDTPCKYTIILKTYGISSPSKGPRVPGIVNFSCKSVPPILCQIKTQEAKGCVPLEVNLCEVIVELESCVSEKRYRIEGVVRSSSKFDRVEVSGAQRFKYFPVCVNGYVHLRNENESVSGSAKNSCATPIMILKPPKHP